MFAGLARPAGATEIVHVSPFSGGSNGTIGTIGSWGNTDASDLTVNVTCWDAFGAAANSRFNVLVLR